MADPITSRIRKAGRRRAARWAHDTGKRLRAAGKQGLAEDHDGVVKPVMARVMLRTGLQLAAFAGTQPVPKPPKPAKLPTTAKPPKAEKVVEAESKPATATTPPEDRKANPEKAARSERALKPEKAPKKAKPEKVPQEPEAAASEQPAKQPAKGAKAAKPRKTSALVAKALTEPGRAVPEARIVRSRPKLPAPTTTEDEVRLLRDELEEIAAGDEPVIVGPFLTEVGFELLYWIPLLRWAVQEYPSLTDRLVIVSRGGPHQWYSGMFRAYVDVFALYDQEQFLRRRPTLKQRDITDFEDEIYNRVREQLGISNAKVLHPMLLFTAYYRVLKIDRLSWSRAIEHGERVTGIASIYEPIPEPEIGPLESQLPDDFVAVRFYFRPSFPDTPENRQLASDVVRNLAQHSNVVLLNNRMELDDHEDLHLADEPRVHTIDQFMRPGDNLHVQTIALSRAKAFVGTYGGLAYLAPFLGLPSLGISSAPEHTHPWHLDLANRVFDGPGWGHLTALSTRDLPLLRMVTDPAGARRTKVKAPDAPAARKAERADANVAAAEQVQAAATQGQEQE